MMADLRPTRRLTSKTIEQALRAFVVPDISKSFSVVSIRVLWRTIRRHEEIAERMIAVKRRQLELLLSKHNDVRCIWSCITGIEEKFKEGEEEKIAVKPGVSFWIVVDVAEAVLSTVQNTFMQLVRIFNN